jgi:Mitochondrial carrier protein
MEHQHVACGPEQIQTAATHPRPLSAGIFNCGTTIIREEGARSLWKGLTPFAGNLTLKYFLRFGTNGLYQNLLRDSVGAGHPKMQLIHTAVRTGSLWLIKEGCDVMAGLQCVRSVIL